MNDLLEKLKEITTNAIRFWELGRVVYNISLAVIVLGFCAYWLLTDKSIHYLEFSMFLIPMAALANLLYTAAYLPDFFAQLSAFRKIWLKCRILLFLLGLFLASFFTVLICANVH